MTRPAPRFVVEYDDGYAALTVNPAGKPVYVEEVVARLELLGVPHVPRQLLEKAVAECSGLPEPLVEWPAGESLCARVDLEISEDRMSARAVLHAARKGGARMSVQRFHAALETAGINHGVRGDVIRRMVDRGEFGIGVEVARGTPPEHGRPRKVSFLFDTAIGVPYLVMEFDRIDLRELNFIQNKHEGEILARLTPSEPARDGRDVFGEVLEARAAGADEELLAGENVGLNPEGDELVALVNGNAFVRSGVVHVEPVVEVDNVNYETGNIDFKGSVVVRNEIADGFTVRAGGCLEVGTCVGRSDLKAGRQIVLRGGVNAGGEGSIECDGDVFARYVESANIRCAGNLVVEEALMHSRVSVHGALLLTGKRAEIVAGTAIVGGAVWCRRLGNVAEVRTRLNVGVNPDTVEEGMQILLRLQTLREESTARRSVENAAESAEIEELERRWAEIRKSIHAHPTAMVVVEDRMFRGVVITLGREELRVPDRGIERTILRLADERILESGYNPAEPPPFPVEPGFK